jgi:23S rRNA (cytidine1920-2'-O)/16S rRNA (cytidine1409-2'-O)-methyltransferase
VVIDLSFISLRLVLPAVAGLLRDGGGGPADVVALVKPQFEAGRGEVGKGGIVRDAAVRRRTLEDVARAAAAAGFEVAGETESPITGADGNVEYFLHLRLAGGPGEAQHPSGRIP